MSKELYPRLYRYRRIVQAKLFIDKHYAEKIDLDNIADEACFSKFHFIRLFRKAFDKTPHQYLSQVRIDKAKELIRSGSPVIDACYRVGFESVTSFTGLFKKMTGRAPALFRQQYNDRWLEISLKPLKFVPGCFASAGTRKSNFEEAGF